jgi:coenzyme F420-0:L-glutamate ligase/coenzyme F420-1:gamma-L-glutamate ligase
MRRRTGRDVGVVITDTFGRPWRHGVTDVAIGVAGLIPVLDLRGTRDAFGHLLEATEVAIVDEIAAAADLVLGKAASTPFAIIRGAPPEWFGEGSISAHVVRRPDEDLFR